MCDIIIILKVYNTPEILDFELLTLLSIIQSQIFQQNNMLAALYFCVQHASK
jgi:hypothetical protein